MTQDISGTFDERLQELSQRLAALRRREKICLNSSLVACAAAMVSLVAFRPDNGAGEAYFLVIPLMIGAAVLIAAAHYLGRKSEGVDLDIAVLVDARFRGTAWKTKAGAIGFVTEAHYRGRRLRLAFPSGAVETYDTNMLEPMPAVEEGRNEGHAGDGR